MSEQLDVDRPDHIYDRDALGFRDHDRDTAHDIAREHRIDIDLLIVFLAANIRYFFPAGNISCERIASTSADVVFVLVLETIALT
jgi:hypothetical protein